MKVHSQYVYSICTHSNVCVCKETRITQQINNCSIITGLLKLISCASRKRPSCYPSYQDEAEEEGSPEALGANLRSGALFYGHGRSPAVSDTRIKTHVTFDCGIQATESR